MRKPLALCALVALALIAPPTVGSSIAAGQPDDLIVTGRVVQQHNATQDTIGDSNDGTLAGAHVLLRWTPDADLASEGDTLSTIAVAEATTSSTGTFELAAKPTGQMIAAAERAGGWLNFNLFVRNARGDTTYNGLSRAIGPDGRWTGENVEEFAPTAMNTTTFAYASDGTALNAELGDGSAQPMDPVCDYSVIRRWVPGSTRIINFHNASNATGGWKYGDQAESDVQVGVKRGSDWTVGATYRVSNVIQNGQGGRTSNEYHKWVRTWFEYELGRYYGDCGNSQQVFARKWTGGVEDDGNTVASCSTQPRLSYRRAYPNGTDFAKGSSRASTITPAISLSGMLSLSSTSGYSSRVDMWWESDTGNGIWLCGQKDYITGNPGVIHATNR